MIPKEIQVIFANIVITLQPILSEVLLIDDDFPHIFSFKDLSGREIEHYSDLWINHQATAQLSDGVLAIGGDIDYTISIGDVYKFSQDTYEWSLEESRLTFPRTSPTAVTVPVSFFCELE